NRNRIFDSSFLGSKHQADARKRILCPRKALRDDLPRSNLMHSNVRLFRSAHLSGRRRFVYLAEDIKYGAQEKKDYKFPTLDFSKYNILIHDNSPFRYCINHLIFVKIPSSISKTSSHRMSISSLL